MAVWCLISTIPTVFLFHDPEICCKTHATHAWLLVPSSLCRLWCALINVYGSATVWLFSLQWIIYASLWCSIFWGLCIPLQLRQPLFWRQPIQIPASIWSNTLFKWIYDWKWLVILFYLCDLISLTTVFLWYHYASVYICQLTLWLTGNFFNLFPFFIYGLHWRVPFRCEGD